ncbi:uncharacterized protein [Amphiura filiformis]
MGSSTIPCSLTSMIFEDGAGLALADVKQLSGPLYSDVPESLISESDFEKSICSDTDVTVICETPSPKQSEEKSHENTSTPKPSLKREDAFSENTSSLFDVKQILSKDKTGRNIIDHLDRYNMLSKMDKKRMTHILCEHIVDTFGYKPPSYIKSDMARGIIEAFPVLKDPRGETGFEGFYCKGSAKSPARGVLEDRICYLRRQYMKEQATPNPPKKLKTSKETSSSKETVSESGKAESDLSEMQEPTLQLQWLKSNAEDPEKVKQYMKQTAKFRHNWIKGNAKPISEILMEFPHMMDSALIEQDFEVLYPDHANKLYARWGKISEILLEWCPKVAPFTLPYLMENEDVSLVEELNPDQRLNIGLAVLPLLFAGVRKKKGGKISSQEALDSFINVQGESTDLEHCVTNNQGGSQPYVLILGGSIANPQQVFTIVENTIIPQNSLLKAVDICLKLVYIFDLQYQPKCSGAWQFLENVVYEFKGVVRSNLLRDFRAYMAFKDSAMC